MTKGKNGFNGETLESQIDEMSQDSGREIAGLESEGSDDGDSFASDKESAPESTGLVFHDKPAKFSPPSAFFPPSDDESVPSLGKENTPKPVAVEKSSSAPATGVPSTGSTPPAKLQRTPSRKDEFFGMQQERLMAVSQAFASPQPSSSSSSSSASFTDFNILSYCGLDKNEDIAFIWDLAQSVSKAPTENNSVTSILTTRVLDKINLADVKSLIAAITARKDPRISAVTGASITQSESTLEKLNSAILLCSKIEEYKEAHEKFKTQTKLYDGNIRANNSAKSRNKKQQDHTKENNIRITHLNKVYDIWQFSPEYTQRITRPLFEQYAQWTEETRVQASKAILSTLESMQKEPKSVKSDQLASFRSKPLPKSPSSKPASSTTSILDSDDEGMQPASSTPKRSANSAKTKLASGKNGRAAEHKTKKPVTPISEASQSTEPSDSATPATTPESTSSPKRRSAGRVKIVSGTPARTTNRRSTRKPGETDKSRVISATPAQFSDESEFSPSVSTSTPKIPARKKAAASPRTTPDQETGSLTPFVPSTNITATPDKESPESLVPAFSAGSGANPVEEMPIASELSLQTAADSAIPPIGYSSLLGSLGNPAALLDLNIDQPLAALSADYARGGNKTEQLRQAVAQGIIFDPLSAFDSTPLSDGEEASADLDALLSELSSPQSTSSSSAPSSSSSSLPSSSSSSSSSAPQLPEDAIIISALVQAVTSLANDIEIQNQITAIAATKADSAATEKSSKSSKESKASSSSLTPEEKEKFARIVNTAQAIVYLNPSLIKEALAFITKGELSAYKADLTRQGVSEQAKFALAVLTQMKVRTIPAQEQANPLKLLDDDGKNGVMKAALKLNMAADLYSVSPERRLPALQNLAEKEKAAIAQDFLLRRKSDEEAQPEQPFAWLRKLIEDASPAQEKSLTELDRIRRTQLSEEDKLILVYLKEALKNKSAKKTVSDSIFTDRAKFLLEQGFGKAIDSNEIAEEQGIIENFALLMDSFTVDNQNKDGRLKTDREKLHELDAFVRTIKDAQTDSSSDDESEKQALNSAIGVVEGYIRKITGISNFLFSSYQPKAAQRLSFGGEISGLDGLPSPVSSSEPSRSRNSLLAAVLAEHPTASQENLLRKKPTKEERKKAKEAKPKPTGITPKLKEKERKRREAITAITPQQQEAISVMRYLLSNVNNQDASFNAALDLISQFEINQYVASNNEDKAQVVEAKLSLETKRMKPAYISAFDFSQEKAALKRVAEQLGIKTAAGNESGRYYAAIQKLDVIDSAKLRAEPNAQASVSSSSAKNTISEAELSERRARKGQTSAPARPTKTPPPLPARTITASSSSSSSTPSSSSSSPVISSTESGEIKRLAEYLTRKDITSSVLAAGLALISDKAIEDAILLGSPGTAATFTALSTKATQEARAQAFTSDDLQQISDACVLQNWTVYNDLYAATLYKELDDGITNLDELQPDLDALQKYAPKANPGTLLTAQRPSFADGLKGWGLIRDTADQDALLAAIDSTRTVHPSISSTSEVYSASSYGLLQVVPVEFLKKAMQSALAEDSSLLSVTDDNTERMKVAMLQKLRANDEFSAKQFSEESIEQAVTVFVEKTTETAKALVAQQYTTPAQSEEPAEPASSASGMPKQKPRLRLFARMMADSAITLHRTLSDSQPQTHEDARSIVTQHVQSDPQIKEAAQEAGISEEDLTELLQGLTTHIDSIDDAELGEQAMIGAFQDIAGHIQDQEDAASLQSMIAARLEEQYSRQANILTRLTAAGIYFLHTYNEEKTAYIRNKQHFTDAELAILEPLSHMAEIISETELPEANNSAANNFAAAGILGQNTDFVRYNEQLDALIEKNPEIIPGILERITIPGNTQHLANLTIRFAITRTEQQIEAAKNARSSKSSSSRSTPSSSSSSRDSDGKNQPSTPASSSAPAGLFSPQSTAILRTRNPKIDIAKLELMVRELAGLTRDSLRAWSESIKSYNLLNNPKTGVTAATINLYSEETRSKLQDFLSTEKRAEDTWQEIRKISRMTGNWRAVGEAIKTIILDGSKLPEGTNNPECLNRIVSALEEKLAQEEKPSTARRKLDISAAGTSMPPSDDDSDLSSFMDGGPGGAGGIFQFSPPEETTKQQAERIVSMITGEYKTQAQKGEGQELAELDAGYALTRNDAFIANIDALTTGGARNVAAGVLLANVMCIEKFPIAARIFNDALAQRRVDISQTISPTLPSVSSSSSTAIQPSAPHISEAGIYAIHRPSSSAAIQPGAAGLDPQASEADGKRVDSEIVTPGLVLSGRRDEDYPTRDDEDESNAGDLGTPDVDLTKKGPQVITVDQYAGIDFPEAAPTAVIQYLNSYGIKTHFYGDLSPTRIEILQTQGAITKQIIDIINAAKATAKAEGISFERTFNIMFSGNIALRNLIKQAAANFNREEFLNTIGLMETSIKPNPLTIMKNLVKQCDELSPDEMPVGGKALPQSAWEQSRERARRNGGLAFALGVGAVLAIPVVGYIKGFGLDTPFMIGDVALTANKNLRTDSHEKEAARIKRKKFREGMKKRYKTGTSIVLQPFALLAEAGAAIGRRVRGNQQQQDVDYGYDDTSSQASAADSSRRDSFNHAQSSSQGNFDYKNTFAGGDIGMGAQPITPSPAVESFGGAGNPTVLIGDRNSSSSYSTSSSSSYYSEDAVPPAGTVNRAPVVSSHVSYPASAAFDLDEQSTSSSSFEKDVVSKPRTNKQAGTTPAGSTTHTASPVPVVKNKADLVPSDERSTSDSSSSSSRESSSKLSSLTASSETDNSYDEEGEESSHSQSSSYSEEKDKSGEAQNGVGVLVDILLTPPRQDAETSHQYPSPFYNPNTGEELGLPNPTPRQLNWGDRTSMIDQVEEQNNTIASSSSSAAPTEPVRDPATKKSGWFSSPFKKKDPTETHVEKLEREGLTRHRRRVEGHRRETLMLNRTGGMPQSSLTRLQREAAEAEAAAEAAAAQPTQPQEADKNNERETKKSSRFPRFFFGGGGKTR